MTHKIIQGEIMPASKRGSIQRRISLLAGSSLTAATIVVAAAGGVLTPAAAWAANECVPVGVDPTANGATADSYSCPNTTSYSGTGITYSSAGPLTVASSGGAINVGAAGLNLSGNTTDSVTLNTTAGTVTGTSGPVIDVTSVSGPISITTAGITGTATGVTYGILADSTGGGDITILSTAGNININSNSGAAQQQSAIRAVTTGGDISITTTGNVTGRLRGIQAQTSGSGTLTINANGNVNVNSSASIGVVAAIDATAGAGLLTINVGDGSINGQNGAAILTNAGGDTVINLGDGTVNSNAAAGLNLTSAGTTTVNNEGTLFASNNTAIRAAGGSFVLNNEGFMRATMDFSGITGSATVNIVGLGTWTTFGTSDFGPGDGTVNNASSIILDSTTTFTGLETFENSGSIVFGSASRALFLPGTDFTGSGASRLQMLATLGTDTQSDCSTLTAASCLSIAGGTTAGVTAVVVSAIGGPQNVLNTGGIVLVDVAGGESHAGDFVLDGASTDFALDSVYGQVLTTSGMLAWALRYDEATQTHRLVTVVPGNRLEYAAGGQEILSTWHSTADLVVGRQADLRRGARRGAWVRGAAEHTTHDVEATFTVAAGEIAYADTWSQDTAMAIAGYDLLASEAGDGSFVLGFHGGYVRSELERDVSPTSDILDGAAAGLYAGWWAGGLTVDATVNLNLLKLTHDRPFGEVSDTNVISTGARAEVGWMLPTSRGFYVQPLLTAAYVRSSAKEVIEKTFEANYDDIQSARIAAGLRAGGQAGFLGYWVLGRAWHEFNDGGGVTIRTPDEAVRFQDDLSGEFQEFGAGLTLSSADETMEGFISGGAKFSDKIDENYNVSLGLRLRW